MAVPYTFGSATTSIPLSQLDSNFATTITLGNTAIQLGNTVTTLNNMTLANVTISSGTSNLAATAITNGTSNVTIASSGGNISIATNGTTAVTIDTSQNVGIGTTSPVTKVDIQSTVGLAYKVKRTSSGVAGGIGAGATTQGLAIFATDFYANTPIIFGVNQTDTSDNPFVGLTERMRINATAPVLCLAGGSTTATGTGIAFPATQSASTDANTLDDYEEGTFTPTLIDGSNNQPTSYSSQVGTYTKVGNLVTIQAYIAIGTLGGTITGSVSIGGLPFTSSSISNNYQGASCGYWGTMNTALNWVGGFINSSTVRIAIYRTTAASVSVTAMQASNWASSDIMFSCSYRV